MHAIPFDVFKGQKSSSQVLFDRLPIGTAVLASCPKTARNRRLDSLEKSHQMVGLGTYFSQLRDVYCFAVVESNMVERPLFLSGLFTKWLFSFSFSDLAELPKLKIRKPQIVEDEQRLMN